MGLRQTKKQRARATIIENAIALFRERGFEATRVRDIAEACELSEATFFNYFAAKDAVLSAWAQAQVAAPFHAISALGDRGLRTLLRKVCGELAASIESDREFAARSWPKVRVSAAAVPDDVVRLLDEGQKSDQLRRDLSARHLGEILYTSICGTLASWLERGAPSGSLVLELRRTADLVLDGARRRNERVRPTNSAAPPNL